MNHVLYQTRLYELLKLSDEIMKNQKYDGYAKGGRGCNSFLCCVLV